MLRFLNAGESHGKGLVGIIEGMPANLSLDPNAINLELKKRQGGYGRGGRMKIEQDRVEVLSGIRNGKTLGSPISLIIKNKDWENWKDTMGIEASEINEQSIVTRPRPGHGDLAGAMKYHQEDIRNILERASARDTAMRVAIGGIAKQFIKTFNIEILSHVLEIGGTASEREDLTIEELKLAEESSVRVVDKKQEKKIIKMIDEARQQGDSLGGIFEVIATNVPMGLGSHVHWDRKLDGKIAQGMMSLQGIKGVEIGMGFESSRRLGSAVHDEIFYKEDYYRSTNNAGGIEAGISNGNPLIVRCAMKPIPTLARPLNSIDMATKTSFKAQKERADVCAVPSASIVAESILAWVISEELVIKLGGDSIEEMKENYQNYLDYLSSR